jgi:HK97 family phage prohead protease
MNTSLEIRVCKGIEVRDADTKRFPGSIGQLVGYAAKFNSHSKEIRQGGVSFIERIRPGAFTRSLALKDDDHDVRMLVGHDKTRILGRQSAGTLEIREDATGLAIVNHVIDTTDGRDMLANVRAGNLDAMSFGFLPKKSAVTKEAGQVYRDLVDVDLPEVSVVTWAAYKDTELAARDFDAFKGELLRVSGAHVPAMQRRRLELLSLELRYGELSVESPSPSYSSVQEQARQASYAAAEATRKARAGNAEDQDNAAKAHKKAAQLNEAASKAAPDYYCALCNEHTALAKMHAKQAA